MDAWGVCVGGMGGISLRLASKESKCMVFEIIMFVLLCFNL